MSPSRQRLSDYPYVVDGPRLPGADGASLLATFRSSCQRRVSSRNGLINGVVCRAAVPRRCSLGVGRRYIYAYSVRVAR